MTTLTLVLPLVRPTPGTEFDYVVSRERGVVLNHGTATAALLPRADQLVLVVPAAALSWHPVRLPPVPASRRRAALDGLLEERLLDDPAQLALALAPARLANGDALVAAFDKAWIRAHLEFFEQSGRPAARVVHVGKRGGCKSTPQAFIEKLMVMAAREGETVVRLKGGDPFIFGRGGEEVEHLRAAGIQVEVVNGITSGLAAVTSLGVPLTHREHAHGVVFVTGHAKPGDEGTDWRSLAATARDARLTLVIYMGVSGARRIQDELLSGLDAATPVAVIQHASLPTQRHAVTTLGQLHVTIEREQLASPSVIVVGDVISGLAAAQAPQLFRAA